MASRILRYSDARHARRLSVIELLSDTENRRDKRTDNAFVPVLCVVLPFLLHPAFPIYL